MVKNSKILRKLERQIIAQERINVQQNYRILDALYREALKLGIFPYNKKDLNLRHKICIARVINYVRKIT